MTSVSRLPSGTVTFLFTDIEGSTRLVKALGESYATVRADHNRLLREAFAAHGGHEIDTQGDAFFVAFRRGRDAIIAAAAAQRALAGHDWPAGGTVKVRMGVHTGEPTVGDDHYVGIGVHRAARIGATGHGGQVVLSSTTHDLVQDDLPAGVSLRDLGRYRLKDIDRPERLYQLDVEDLPAKFPPLKAARMPSRLSAFVRRPVNAAGIAVVFAATLVFVALLIRGSNTAHATGLEHVTPNSVGIVDATSGKIGAEVSIGSSPAGLTYGFGALWATDNDRGTVTRIDPSLKARVQTIRTGVAPDGIAATSGAVWVANSLDGTVSRIDPITNSVVGSPIPVGNEPTRIAAGGGALWIAVSGDKRVLRIDPVTGRVGPTIATGSGADGVAFGAGSVWVTSRQSGTVSRFDPETTSLVARVNVGNGASDVSFGAGSIWVANTLDDTVSKIDPETNTVKAAIPVGAGPASVAFGSGSVWVANEFGGTLARIDPATNAVRTYELGNRPAQVAAGAGSVFVGVGGAGPAHRGGTLHLETDRGPSLDPAIAYDTGSWSVLALTHDGLVAFKRVPGLNGTTLVPDLATALPAAGGSTYAFTLRPGIHYSNGRPVRASDFQRAIGRVLELHSGAGYYDGLVGAASCAKSRTQCDLSRGVVTDDETRTVTFHLATPNPEFLYALALPFASAVPADTPARDMREARVPGTGAYTIGRVSRGHTLRLVRNPFFHEWSRAAQPAGYPDRIEVKRTPLKWTEADGAAMAREIQRGRLDWVPSGQIPARLIDELHVQLAGQFHDTPSALTSYLALNTRRRPFTDVRVRRALNYALDRVALLKATVGDVSQWAPTCQILPPNFPGYRPYCPYTLRPSAERWSAPDVASADRLVAASHSAGARVRIAVPSGGDELGRYLASVLRKLGFRPELVRFPNDRAYAHQTADSRRDFEITANSWQADYPSPSTFFGPNLSCASFHPAAPNQNSNLAEFCDPAIDREVARARTIEGNDPQTARTLWAHIDRQVTDEAPWVAMVNPRGYVDFVSKRLGNYQVNPQLGVLFSQLWVR